MRLTTVAKTARSLATRAVTAGAVRTPSQPSSSAIHIYEQGGVASVL